MLFRTLFGKMPKTGEQYVYDDFDTKNPFKTEKRHTVTVTDVIGKYVKYKFDNSTMWQNESLPRASFLGCYKKLS